VAQVLILSDFTRKQQDLPSNHRIKQIMVGWLERVQMLWESIPKCNKIDEKINNSFFKSLEIFKKLNRQKLIRDSFFKSLEIFKELNIPKLIRDSMIITKEKLEKELNNIKASWGSEFDNLNNFPKEEIWLWLFIFINTNEDHLTSL
jgi:hypothetical protein